MADSSRAITKFIVMIFLDLRDQLTWENESIDGDSVVFVLLVGICASEAKASQESTKEVEDKTDNNKSSCSSEVTLTVKLDYKVCSRIDGMV